MIWETVIGLEVHAQLKTASKLFSGSATQYGALANTQTNFIDAGLPGVLPVLNQKAVEMAIQFGLAIHAEINDLSFFERKNYFYPDLPKGYQISQLQRPIVSNGHLMISYGELEQTKKVIIERAHLEEDAGKSLHEAHPSYTGIDLNRAGTPLLEIVTTPCLTSAQEAISYLKTLHQLLRFLAICDGNMQEGSFRCDVNLSIKPQGSAQLGTRTELKNLNSFRFIEKAIAYEQNRHQELLESGQIIQQQTRLYCPDTNTTHPMRDKENENDYRYFPDPDLLPIKITAETLAKIANNMPTLPDQLRKKLLEEDALASDDIEFLITSPALLRYYSAVKHKSQTPPKTIVNWLKGTYTAALNEQGLDFDQAPVSPERFSCLLDRVTQNSVSVKIAKQIFAKLMTTTLEVDEIIAAEGYQQVNDTAMLYKLIVETIANYPQQAADYRAGKEKLLSFFVGQIMKKTQGQASPDEVNRLLKHYL
ncbi:Asp-tRNA(Asn)/Glu-tRNA(Gln) amidotransferase subunit GatB [bacterium]|nr:Asp-tRNA(Asn)/Glu-tRNA(Gln) amidotransferase subunit GatB [bacterium]